MERDFNWLWENLKEGARQKFEDICYEIYLNEYSEADVHKVPAKQGDGGIDVYIDEQNGKYTVIQCKFFLKEVGENRQGQIRSSFATAIEKNCEIMNEWILCVPTDLTYKEHEWWRRWKKKQQEKHSISIKLHDESKLMRLIRKHDLYDEYFNTVRVDRRFIEDIVTEDEKTQIHNRIYPLISSLLGVDYWIPSIITMVDSLMDLKAHRFFKNNNLLKYLDELTTLYSYHAHINIIRDPEMSEKETELRIKIRDEYSKLNF